jgi:hypothetical protein
MKKLIFIALLLFTQQIYAQEIKMPKEQWLANLKTILPAHLCKPASPFLKVYKGNNCQADTTGLFNKCTTEVDNVSIPDYITSIPQANMLGQVIAECMSAHYQGGNALKMFNLVQNVRNKKK